MTHRINAVVLAVFASSLAVAIELGTSGPASAAGECLTRSGSESDQAGRVHHRRCRYFETTKVTASPTALPNDQPSPNGSPEQSWLSRLVAGLKQKLSIGIQEPAPPEDATTGTSIPAPNPPKRSARAFKHRSHVASRQEMRDAARPDVSRPDDAQSQSSARPGGARRHQDRLYGASDAHPANYSVASYKRWPRSSAASPSTTRATTAEQPFAGRLADAIAPASATANIKLAPPFGTPTYAQIEIPEVSRDDPAPPQSKAPPQPPFKPQLTPLPQYADVLGMLPSPEQLARDDIAPPLSATPQSDPHRAAPSSAAAYSGWSIQLFWTGPFEMAFAFVPLALALVLLAGAYERRRNASNAVDHERVAIRPVLSWPLR